MAAHLQTDATAESKITSQSHLLEKPSSLVPGNLAPLISRLRSVGDAPDPYQIHQHGRSAVMVPLTVRKSSAGYELDVILTKRSAGMSFHGGAIVLPGGKLDDVDPTLLATALREAEEEIALPPSLVEPLCTLPLHLARDDLIVTPIVCLVHPSFRPVCNPAEVQAVVRVPLKTFLEPEDGQHSSYQSWWKRRLVHTYNVQVFWEGDDSNAPQSTPDAVSEPVARSDVVNWMTADICLETAVAAFGREPNFERNGTWTKDIERSQRWKKVESSDGSARQSSRKRKGVM
ncbi:hypothetical protein M427DRAFT_28822 [Gonapodya prolifera JEL478]|uniref:Nudix hydrolase domain-containing protein n=1 Tax=Gonapodya prolifera (strain JEL478) TaxID=1344416 RepID=A0A139ATB2_GONPJ|nr:hypothetical protein M427DRAFT_28822 [Gonapodya prolifera JEL478]|eukprot:KXS19962.1 hypothetical protein M427DRAFT_28822 [Gonapodya prolifera JEL478]